MPPYHLMNQAQMPQPSIQSRPSPDPALPTSLIFQLSLHHDKTTWSLTPNSAPPGMEGRWTVINHFANERGKTPGEERGGCE